ncbi:MAG: hypothetical protein EB072_17485 [Betaproteobacteria bacterium]|nr:hypothetical protein [Betaproteobacteria bacterium]
MTLSGVVSGTTSEANGLEKRGTGELTLTGANAFSGGTTISSGILRLGANNALGSGNIRVNGGGTLDLNGHNLTAADQPLKVAGIGAPAAQGSSGLGAIRNSSSEASTIEGLITLTDNALFKVKGSGALNLHGGVQGAHVLAIETDGTLTVGSGSNLYRQHEPRSAKSSSKPIRLTSATLAGWILPLACP